MKKWISIGCILVVLVLVGGLLMQSSMMYGGDEIVDGGLRYYPHAFFKTCFVADLTWPAGETEAVMDLPDTCGGYRVTELGGYIGKGLPCPFTVTMADSVVVYSEGALPENAQVEAWHLILNVGRNLEENTNIEMDGYYRIGPNRFVQILVTVHCSVENPHFYAENGRLYRKADDSQVEGFVYQSEE